MSRCIATALAVVIVLLLWSDSAGATSTPRTVAACSWSYFGDPRAVAHQGHVYSGCIGTTGSSFVEDYDLVTGERRLDEVFDPLEVDDHNNPSLVVFQGRLYAFSSPHSGYLYPRDRRSQMRYRILDGDDWGAVRTVPLGDGCGLGYTYPNPVVAGDRLYLFMRGPCWAPYFADTADGEHWTAPRTLMESPPSSAQDGGGTRRVRPYAKYAGAADGSVLMTFSDGHPASFKSSLYFVRMFHGRFYAADGRLVGTVADLPLHFSDLDPVHPYSPATGRAWPMDIALDRTGAPVVVYSALIGTEDVFRYGRWNGSEWRTHAIAPAGRTLFTYHNSGVTLDHTDPTRVVLSRTIAGRNEIEARQTPDEGSTWRAVQITRGSRGFNIRPVIPRGLGESDRLVVLYVAGSATSFREYDTTVVMRSVTWPGDRGRTLASPGTPASDIQATWPCSPLGRCSPDTASRRPSAAGVWESSTALASSVWSGMWRSRSSLPSGSAMPAARPGS
jgi:hypothetical protein